MLVLMPWLFAMRWLGAFKPGSVMHKTNPAAPDTSYISCLKTKQFRIIVLVSLLCFCNLFMAWKLKLLAKVFLKGAFLGVNCSAVVDTK